MIGGKVIQPTKSFQSQSLVKLPDRLLSVVTRAKFMLEQMIRSD